MPEYAADCSTWIRARVEPDVDPRRDGDNQHDERWPVELVKPVGQRYREPVGQDGKPVPDREQRCSELHWTLPSAARTGALRGADRHQACRRQTLAHQPADMVRGYTAAKAGADPPGDLVHGRLAV